MNAQNAKDIAREWVHEVAVHDRYFVGAVLHGSVNWMANEDELAPTSDLDVLVIREGDPGASKPGKFLYRDLLLEVSHLQWDEISSPEHLLANYQLVGSFRSEPLADVDGRLTELIAIISAQYARHEWVDARVQRACDRALTAFPHRSEDALHDQVTCWLFSMGALCHIVLVAALENPTVRKRYLAAKMLLERFGFADEYEAMLDLLGCREMPPARTLEHLASMTEAFDAARKLGDRGHFFSADLSDDARMVAVDGSRELIASGYHREAIFWIVATYCRCRKVLATRDAEQAFDSGFFALLSDLGVSTFEERERRIERLRATLPHVREIAREITSRTAGVTNG